MDCKIESNQELSNSPTKSKRRPKYNLLDSVVVRTIICIVIIDLAIWGYFATQGKGFFEGVKGWQYNFREFVGLNNEQKIIKRRIVINKIENRKKYQTIVPRNNSNEIQPTTTEKLYSWKDEKGIIHYSNTGFPEGNVEKLYVKDIKR